MSATAPTRPSALLTPTKIDALCREIRRVIQQDKTRLDGLNIAIAKLQEHGAECDDEVEEAEDLARRIFEAEQSYEQMQSLANLSRGKIDTAQN